MTVYMSHSYESEVDDSELLIEARLAEAGRIMKRLPAADRRHVDQLKRLRAHWPDFVREGFDAWISYNRENATYRAPPPTAVEIDRMDEALVWLSWLYPQSLPPKIPSDVGRIVWSRAVDHAGWRTIMRLRRQRSGSKIPGGNSHVMVRQHYRSAITVIKNNLIRAGIELKLPVDWTS